MVYYYLMIHWLHPLLLQRHRYLLAELHKSDLAFHIFWKQKAKFLYFWFYIIFTLGIIFVGRQWYRLVTFVSVSMRLFRSRSSKRTMWRFRYFNSKRKFSSQRGRVFIYSSGRANFFIFLVFFLPSFIPALPYFFRWFYIRQRFKCG